MYVLDLINTGVEKPTVLLVGATILGMVITTPLPP